MKLDMAAEFYFDEAGNLLHTGRMSSRLARAEELGALAQQGTALDMAQQISQQHG